MVCRGVGGGSVTPEPKQFFGVLRFKHPHPRYPKTPFLAHGAQRCGWLECHPRTHTIFFGIVRFKHTHPRYPKTHFWPMVCRGMGGWSATPEPVQYFWQGCLWQGCSSVSAPQKKTPERTLIFFIVRQLPAPWSPRHPRAKEEVRETASLHPPSDPCHPSSGQPPARNAVPYQLRNSAAPERRGTSGGGARRQCPPPVKPAIRSCGQGCAPLPPPRVLPHHPGGHVRRRNLVLACRWCAP